MPIEQTRLPKIVVISGNTHRPSKSRSLAESIVHAVKTRLAVDLRAFDIIDAGPGLGAAYTRQDLTPEALQIIEAIESADALIVSTPVYKGSYPGLFKHLLDFVERTSLVNRPVLLAATGGSLKYALVVEYQLRPLFGYFASQTVPAAIYASDNDFVDGTIADPIVKERIELAAAQFAALLRHLELRSISEAA